MTQQPYAPQPQYAPQYPQAPQPQYAPAPPVYAPPVQYAPQGYPPPPQQPPAAPLAQGSIDDYYAQPSAGSGPSISWSDKNRQPKPIGTSYAGIVTRDVTNADIQQQTDYNTKQPKFYRDGRPMFAMKVPLRVQPSEEFPEGEASWYVKGQARDELVRAMAQAGCEGAPKAGATIQVTLSARKASGGGLNPANHVSVIYTPAPGEATAPAAVQPTIAQAPVQQAAPVAAPVQYAPPIAQPVAPPVAQAPVQQALPPQPPAGMPADQAALLAQITGQAPVPAQG